MIEQIKDAVSKKIKDDFESGKILETVINHPKAKVIMVDVDKVLSKHLGDDSLTMSLVRTVLTSIIPYDNSSLVKDTDLPSKPGNVITSIDDLAH